MRTETDPTQNEKPWKPFGEKVERKAPSVPEWQPSPDAPGVEYNWKTGKTRTNMPLPNVWVEDYMMIQCDVPHKVDAAYKAYHAISASLTDEQSAFEVWLDRERPSGDVESVQYQWIKSSDYADYQDLLCP